MNKKKYLAVYDYGAGGVWVYIYANTPNEITAKYPELKVVADPPEWWDEVNEKKTLDNLTFDIMDPPQSFLQALVAERKKRY